MAKKLLIRELDLSGINADERGRTTDRLIGSTTLYLEERYPVARGYKHSRMEFKPHEETHPQLVGVHLTVQRGSIWGYTVTFMPLVVENQDVSVTLSTNPRLFDIVGFSALAPVLLLVVWVLGTARINFQEIKRPMLTLLFSFLALLGLWMGLAGILWLPIRALMSLKIDKHAQEQEIDDLRAEIRDLLVAPAS